MINLIHQLLELEDLVINISTMFQSFSLTGDSHVPVLWHFRKIMKHTQSRTCLTCPDTNALLVIIRLIIIFWKNCARCTTGAHSALTFRWVLPEIEKAVRRVDSENTRNTFNWKFPRSSSARNRKQLPEIFPISTFWPLQPILLFFFFVVFISQRRLNLPLCLLLSVSFQGSRYFFFFNWIIQFRGNRD